MGVNLIGFLTFVFIGMTQINRIIGGQIFASTDIAQLNQLVVFRPATILNWFTIPVPNLSFVVGLYHLVSWDQSFFGGNAAILMYFFYTLTAMLSFLLFGMAIGVAYNMLRVR